MLVFTICHSAFYTLNFLVVEMFYTNKLAFAFAIIYWAGWIHCYKESVINLSNSLHFTSEAIDVFAACKQDGKGHFRFVFIKVSGGGAFWKQQNRRKLYKTWIC